MTQFQAKRSTEEVITLAMCALCVAGLGLFSVLRYLKGDYAIAGVDLIGFVITFAIFVQVYTTHRYVLAGLFLAILGLGGTAAIIYLGGPAERYLLYPTTVAVFFLATHTRALGISLIGVLLSGFVLLPSLDLFEFGKFLLSISGCILFAYIFARERNLQRDKLLKLSTVDALTGAANRRAFDDHLAEVIRMQQRVPTPMSMILIDVDNFKAINDKEGHSIGDDVLQLIAATIMHRLRAGENLYRYGGDEFVITANASLTTALSLAEELRLLVENAPAVSSMTATLSIGVAEYSAAESAAHWLQRTDQALFEAKRAGRNRVQSA